MVFMVQGFLLGLVSKNTATAATPKVARTRTAHEQTCQSRSAPVSADVFGTHMAVSQVEVLV